MKSNLKKSLLVSGAVLSLFLFSNISISTHHLIDNPTRIEIHAATLYGRGYNNGYSSSVNFYKNMTFDYDLDDNITPYTAARLYINHAPVNNRYEDGYIKGYNTYSHKPYDRHNHTNARDYPKSLVSSKNYGQALDIYRYFRQKPYSYFKGYSDRLAIDSSTDDSNKVPKKYRYNVDYAKGYLLGAKPKVNSPRMLNHLFAFDQYNLYWQAYGRVPYVKLFSNHYQSLYHNYWQMIENEEHNAMTEHQVLKYFQYYMNKLHLNKSDRKVFKCFCENTFEEMPYNGGIDTNTSAYLWKGTGFARNLICKAPFHKNVYYSKWAIKSDEDPLSPSSAFDGVIIGLHGNNTKAARNTADNLVNYIENKYYSKHQNKAIIYKFHKNYKINPVIEAESITGSHLDYTKGVSIYHVYNKRSKHSMVAYYIPNGKGPLGQLPGMNG